MSLNPYLRSAIGDKLHIQNMNVQSPAVWKATIITRSRSTF